MGDLDDPVKGFGNSSITVQECETACTGLAGCTGVKFLTANGGSACYRQSDIVLPQCKTGDAHWTMFLRPVVWEEHSMYNCGAGHGARDLDDPVRGFGNSSIMVESAKRLARGLQDAQASSSSRRMAATPAIVSLTSFSPSARQATLTGRCS